MELMILDWLQNLRTPVGDCVMTFITGLGDRGAVWILLTAVLLAVPKTRRSGAVLAAALCVDMVLCNGILKNLIGRVRPFDVNGSVRLLIARPDDFSFPSGHTAASFTAVSALFLAGEKRLWKLILPLAVLMACSRLYLYVHYPTDILGGTAVGILSGYAGYRMIEKLQKKIRNIGDGKRGNTDVLMENRKTGNEDIPGGNRKRGNTDVPGGRGFSCVLAVSVSFLVIFSVFLALQRYCFPTVRQNVQDETLQEEFQGDTGSPSRQSSSVPSIDIQEKTVGEGREKITYYAAEIRLGDATDLRTAFAKNQYGLNIRDTVSGMAEEHDAVFAVNGDYYGNRTDGLVIRDGILYREISGGRECLVLYRDGTAGIVQEGQVTGESLIEQGAWNAFSFGPVLVEDGKIRDNLEEPYKVDDISVSITDKNPRTGIGILGENHLLVIAVDGRREGYSCGMTLQEFARLFADYGCQLAYNLDGGSSVTLYQDGQILNRPCTGSGEEREISDIIYVK